MILNRLLPILSRFILVESKKKNLIVNSFIYLLSFFFFYLERENCVEISIFFLLFLAAYLSLSFKCFNQVYNKKIMSDTKTMMSIICIFVLYQNTKIYHQPSQFLRLVYLVLKHQLLQRISSTISQSSSRKSPLSRASNKLI